VWDGPTVTECLYDGECLWANAVLCRSTGRLAGTRRVDVSTSIHRRTNQQTPVTSARQCHHCTADTAYTLCRRVHVSWRTENKQYLKDFKKSVYFTRNTLQRYAASPAIWDYLPLDTFKRALPSKPVLDSRTLEKWKDKLNLVLVIYRDSLPVWRESPIQVVTTS